MDILDVFNADAFGLVSLTEAINNIQPTFGKLGALNIFHEEGQTQRVIAVDYDAINIVLLPQTPWGGPGTPNKSGLMKTYAFSIPHYALQDSVKAADLQGRRRLGSDAVQDAQYVLGKKMLEMKRKLDVTREWMRLGVLKGGIVKDGAGTTIVNLFTLLGGSQSSTSFALSTPTTDVIEKISVVKRLTEAALLGDTATGYVALCSDGFYDAFVRYANVKTAFQYYSVNGQNLAGDYRVKGFVFGEALWLNYTDAITVPDPTGTQQQPIDANSAYLVPTGTRVFPEWFAPADYMETVNTVGQPFYAKQERMEFDKGIKLECQMSPLPVCLNPAVIQKLPIS